MNRMSERGLSKEQGLPCDGGRPQDLDKGAVKRKVAKAELRFSVSVPVPIALPESLAADCCQGVAQRGAHSCYGVRYPLPNPLSTLPSFKGREKKNLSCCMDEQPSRALRKRREGSVSNSSPSIVGENTRIVAVEHAIMS